MITRDEFHEICRLVCPHCRAGLFVGHRSETGEWVHDHIKEIAHSHTICWANGFRNSRFAEVMKDG